MTFIIYSPYPTYIRVVFCGTLHKLNFMYVGISLNSVQCKYFISCAGKITKVCFEMYKRKIKTIPSMYFWCPRQVLHLFPTRWKMRFQFFFFF